MVLQYNIDFGWEPCALAPDLKTLSGCRVCVSKLSGPYQKPLCCSIVLSFFGILSVYIFIFKNKTQNNSRKFDQYFYLLPPKRKCLYNKIQINTGKVLLVLFCTAGSRFVFRSRPVLYFFTAKPVHMLGYQYLYRYRYQYRLLSGAS